MYEVEKMYFDYKNNFLTMEKFAEHYEFTIEQARTIVDWWREYNRNR